MSCAPQLREQVNKNVVLGGTRLTYVLLSTSNTPDSNTLRLTNLLFRR